MGGTVNAAEAAVRNAQDNAQGAAAKQQQGVLGGRQVTDQQEGTDGPSLRERQQAGSVSGDTAERTSLQSRQATEARPASASIDPAVRLARVLAPPDLEPIVLTNAQGVTLFRGLRHGMLKADGLDLALLKSLPDDQLHSLFEQMHPFLPRLDPSERLPLLARHTAAIRATNSRRAEVQVDLLRHGVRRHFAEEVAATALAMDPQKCERASKGETVDLHLCAVSLSGPEAHLVSEKQAQHLSDLTRWSPGEPLESLHGENPDFHSQPLRLRDPDGVQQTVLAKISVRQFGLKPNQSKTEIERLLGAIGSNRLTGDAGKQADAIEARALEGFATPLSHALGRLRAAPGDVADHADLQQLRNALAENHKTIEAGLKSRSGKSRTLAEAGAQLKALWAARGDWPPGADAHPRAAALIALVAHHMGETPLLSSDDKTLTERLEAEVKYLATYADSHEGHLPAFDSRVQE